MSGFNLLTSAKSDGRHIVAVVLGGRSGGSRDIAMAGLVNNHLERAYAGARTAPMVAERAAEERARPVVVASNEPSLREMPAPVAPEPTRPAPVTTATIERGVRSAPPIEIQTPKTAAPKAVDVVNVKPVVASATATPPTPSSTPVAPRAVIAAVTPTTTPTLQPASPAPNGAAMRWVTGAQPAVKEADRLATATETARAYAPAESARPVEAKLQDRLGAPKPASPPVALAKAEPETRTPRTPAVAEEAERPTARPASAAIGWVIQLGATDDQDKARSILSQAKAQTRALAKAEPFTEKVTKGGAVLWRARFAGFDADEAQETCKALKRGGFSCFATKG